MSILGRYLNRLLLSRFALVMSGLVLIVLSLDLMETADNVLNVSDGTMAPLLRYASLRLPDLAAKLLPVAALLAAILAIVELSRYREIVAVWGTGLSPLRLILAALPACILLGGIQAVLDNWAAPKGLQELYSWGVGPYQRISSTEDSNAIWLHVNDDILRIPSGSAQSGDLRNVIIFRRGTDGLLLEKLHVSRMEPKAEDLWRLTDVSRWATDGQDEEQLPVLEWRGELNLKGVALLAGEPRELTYQQLKELIARDAYGQRSVDLYETWLHFRFVSTTAPFFMVVLSLAIAYWLGAAASIARLFIVTLSLGFTFFIFSQTALAMGKVGLLPPWLAAWAPCLCLACVVAILLLRREPTGRSAPPIVRAAT